MHTPKLPLIIMALLAALLVLPRAALACTCGPELSPLEAHAQATLVFVGRVSAMIGNPADEGASQLVTFEVQAFWKGEEQPQVTLLTPSASVNCGYVFERGSDYVVYANVVDNQLRTNSCMRTAPLAAANNDLNALGPSTPVTSAYGDHSSVDMDIPWLPLIMIILALLTGTLFFGPKFFGRR
ncbi:MAG: hypothetical protein EI684_05510 [Candidatus Viridilinea halotolerans]|uniref:Tissue inhibitor of metalloproteinase n=1 Tax=Candidatus Viridilinea halotolerans TaxID=2491704 RepID=A0A426U592_9CHLR|nr:MAG: hypothetical protein EI684_05510 [Candidatus Viridilinea halotolerans]